MKPVLLLSMGWSACMRSTYGKIQNDKDFVKEAQSWWKHKWMMNIITVDFINIRQLSRR
jgi:hypothetical protein